MLLTKTRAYKIPNPRSWRNFLWGILSNLTEAEFGKPPVFPGLCQVLWSDPLGFMIVMPRAERITRQEFEELRTTAHPTVLSMGENKYLNFGKIRGELVCIDYGVST